MSETSIYFGLESAWILWLVYWIRSATHTAPSLRTSSFLAGAAYTGSIVVGAILIFVCPGASLWPVTVATLCVAPILVIYGLAVSIMARRKLGRYWSGPVAIKHGHKLIESGPYGLVRHPIYSGILLSMGATVAMIGTLESVCGYGLVVGALLLKVALEERLLVEYFGSAYRDYQRRVKALIPGIV